MHHSGQCKIIGLLAIAGQYHHQLHTLVLLINPTPSWEPVEFHNQFTENNCIHYLAMHGVTEDEADDCLNFAFSWLQSAVETKEDVPHLIFIQGALQVVRQHPDISHWPEDMVHIYDQSHARWLLFPPLLGMTTAHPYPSSTTEGEVLPLQAGPGTAALLPPTLVVVPLPLMIVVGSTKTSSRCNGSPPYRGTDP